MDWIDSIGEAIDYIEERLTEELSVETIAERVLISPFYFQKGFSMLCGFTVGEYIKQRRLALAGGELVSSNDKIIDVALKYGYDSPDAFTKAFTRFHGVTPTAVRKEGAALKAFAPLKITLKLEGGFIMDYKIADKPAFTVTGVSKKFAYEGAERKIPEFWTETFCKKTGPLCGMYGINIDESMSGGEFEYWIADDYHAGAEVPHGCSTMTVPAFTWAIFPCKGSMPEAMQEVNRKIFSEWLPNCKDYEFAAGYLIELYESPADYPDGVRDVNYESEIWIPVRRKTSAE